MKPRVAVIGAGVMGTQHARVVARSDRCELGLVVDADLARAEETARQHDVSASQDIGAALECDLVIVASPTGTHPAVVDAVLDAGRPVLVEKPLAPSAAEARRMVERSAEAGVPLLCGFVERFNPAFQTARDLLDGDPLHVVSIRHSPRNTRVMTDVVHDLLVHDLDLAVALCGPPTTAVAGGWRPPDGELEIVDAIVRFAGGAVATCSADRWTQRKVRTLTVSTDSQLIEVDLLRQDVTVYRHVRHDVSGGGYRSETVMDIPFVRSSGEPLAVQLDHLLDVAAGIEDPDVERATLLPAHELAGTIADLARA